MTSDKIGTLNEKMRHAWVKDRLEKVPAGSKILDVGAGEMVFKKWCQHLSYTSQDSNQYTGRGNNKGLQTVDWNTKNIDIVSDITRIPVENSSYDAILCTEVLEHIPYPEMAVQEFRRILKPEGKLLITAPFASIVHFAPYYYANGFSKYWYEKVLPENGFVIEELKSNGNYFQYIAQEIGRLPWVAEHYSTTDSFLIACLRATCKSILYLLEKIDGKSKNSEELLCHGIFVAAEKSRV